MARGGSVLAGLIGGALAGAVAGLLLAPKAGKEAREIVREKGEEYINKGEEYATSLRDRIRRRQSEEESGDAVEVSEEQKESEDQS